MIPRSGPVPELALHEENPAACEGARGFLLEPPNYFVTASVPFMMPAWPGNEQNQA